MSRSINDWLSVEEAAEVCGFDRAGMYYYLSEKSVDKPPFERKGNRYYFPKEALKAWNERRKQKPFGKKRRGIDAPLTNP